ncbi:replication initiation negative regulator SeqA [Alteromonas sp. S167]|uniref:replication initiation negative regulator SeqA n=1 Tax=Alteromonas sp. S167 TaxID=3117402 RepID=UPI002FE251B9
MKSIEIDDDLYAFIASQTKHIGESASQILRRLLLPEDGAASNNSESEHSTENGASIIKETKTNEIKKAETHTESKPEPVEPSESVKNSSAEEATAASATMQNVSAKANATTKTDNKKTPVKKPVAKAPVKKAPIKKATAKSAAPDVTASHDKRDILDAVSKDALSTFTKRVDQFLFILSAAHKLNAENFSSVESIKGKNRTYFATSKEALLENGSSTNPKAIPDSPFWVVTNNNTAKKTNMLEQVLRNLGYQADVIESVVARFSSEGK